MFAHHKKTETTTEAKAAPSKAPTSPQPTRQPTWTNALSPQPALALQPKLTINQPGDEYEQEAAHVAAQVMRMATPAVMQVQRCACGGIAGPDGECAACKAKRLGLQRKGDGISHTEAPPSVHQTLRSSGQSLDVGTRAFMEPRFGQDFSDVRIHTDSQAAQSAADVSARAYTVGNNVVFGAGQYSPSTTDGKQLLAHELTHVGQQINLHYQVMRQAALAEPMPFEPMPVEPPPLEVIPGGRTDPGGRPFPTPGGGPRYAPPIPDNSLEGMLRSMDRDAKRGHDIMEAERPKATLEHGGIAPTFVTVDGQQEGAWEWGNYKYRVRSFHILDAIEYEVAQASTVQQLEEILNRHIGPLDPTKPLPFFFPGPETPTYPDGFDPGLIVRKRTYSKAVRRRIRQAPQLSSAERLAAQTDVDTALNQMSRRRRRPNAYPICWASQLQITRGTTFTRTKSERDEEEQKQARMALDWRAFRDPDFDPKKSHVHHVVPLFLGGEDNLRTNGVPLEKRTHLRGHWVLRIQPQMLFPPLPLKPMPVDLYEHPPGTEYELVGFKEDAQDLCTGGFGSTDDYSHPNLE